jgi:hypothetical protein
MAVTMEGLSLSGAFNHSLRAKDCSEHQPGVHKSPIVVGIYRRPDRVLFSLRISRRKLQTNAICIIGRVLESLAMVEGELFAGNLSFLVVCISCCL